MPNPNYPTLLDIAKLSGIDAVVGLVEEVINFYPELSGRSDTGVALPNVGASRTIKGTQYKTLIRTAIPTVGFRNANEGSTAQKSTYENRLVETFIMNPIWKCDKAVADANEDGAEAFIALEASAIMQGAMKALAEQFYYGRAKDAKGHPGIIDSVDSSMVIDAGGTTDNTASSVWAVKFGPKDVQWVYGQNGSLDLSPARIESIVDPNDNTKSFTGYVQELFAYPGVQCLSKYSVGRIKKLTQDSGKGLTDALLYSLINAFPSGVRPDVIFMTRRSREQWRKSRTATNATGAPAPIPTEFEGIPVAATDALSNTEALAL